MVIKWTSYSENCLKEIHEYLSNTNKSLASSTIDSIVESVEILNTFPCAGYREVDNREHHIRTLLHGHYKIAYHIINEQTIRIIGVYHAASNYKWKIKRDIDGI